MKRKTIFVLTLTAALLTVSGFCIANAAEQSERGQLEPVTVKEEPEKMLMKYASDIADPDYEKNLTDEQCAFNDMINKQIYKEIAEDIKQYEVYGLAYDTEENQMYFNNEPICCFIDNLAIDGTFKGTEYHSPNGNTGIVAERDEKGTLTGLMQLSGQELNDVLTHSWHN